jgi:hypothetical protein
MLTDYFEFGTRFGTGERMSGKEIDDCRKFKIATRGNDNFGCYIVVIEQRSCQTARPLVDVLSLLYPSILIAKFLFYFLIMPLGVEYALVLCS